MIKLIERDKFKKLRIITIGSGYIKNTTGEFEALFLRDFGFLFTEDKYTLVQAICTVLSFSSSPKTIEICNNLLCSDTEALYLEIVGKRPRLYPLEEAFMLEEVTMASWEDIAIVGDLIHSYRKKQYQSGYYE